MGIGWTPLPQPRSLTAAEHALLDRLVAHADCAELTAQAASVRVTGVCECGCPSVRLETDAPALSRATMLRLSAFGRDDWFAIDYTRISGADVRARNERGGGDRTRGADVRARNERGGGDRTRADDAAADPVDGESPMLQIIVHVTQGSLHELEIFAGEGRAVELPSPDELDDVTIG